MTYIGIFRIRVIILYLSSLHGILDFEPPIIFHSIICIQPNKRIHSCGGVKITGLFLLFQLTLLTLITNVR